MMKKTLLTVAVIVVAMQLIRPDFTNPPLDSAVVLHADTAVMEVLKTSCYDCHSSETSYPWYHQVAPVSWIMAKNITEGRKALDFSHWAAIDPETKLLRMKRAKQVVANEMMPKREYLWMHEHAVLSPQGKQVLTQFFDSQITELGGKPNDQF